MADNTYTPTVNFTGIASGIDFNAMIDAYLKVEGRYKEQLEQRKEDYENKIQLAQELNSLILDLKNTVEEMDTPEEFIERNAISSNENVLTATATSEATPGTHTIIVGENINHRLASQGFDDEDTATDGLQYTVINADSGSVTVTITVGDTTAFTKTYNTDVDIKTLVDDINTATSNDTDNDGVPEYVRAEIINDGSSSKPYRLVLTSVEGGSSNKVSISVTTSGTASFNLDFSSGFDNVEWLKQADTTTADIGVSGSYRGYVNKSFIFTVTKGGTVDSDTIVISWKDTVEGKTGTLTISSSGDYEVYQGLTLTFNTGDVLNTGDVFKVDVFHPELQKAQDTGLARPDVLVHAGFPDKDITPVTTTPGKFVYTYAGEEYSIDIPAGTTLEQLARYINNDPNNPGVTATIMNDGTGSPTAYHLVLTGQSGAAFVLEVDSANTTLDNFTVSFTKTQEAQNSMIKVDGFPRDVEDPSDPDVLISSSYAYIQNLTNTITDAIKGVTLFLKDTGEVNLTIETDTESMKKKIQDFVDAYNKVIDKVEELTKFDPTGENMGPFIGNPAINFVENVLMQVISSSLPGFKPGVDKYTSLSQIGIRTGDNKRLEIHEEELDEALQTAPDEVAKLFSANMEPYIYTESVENGEYIEYISRFPDTKPGFYQVTFNIANEEGSFRYKENWYQAYSEERVYPLDSDGAEYYYLTGLTKGTPEYGLTLRTRDYYPDTLELIPDPQIAELRILRGAFGTLVDKLEFITDPNSPLNSLIDSYTETVDNLEEQIQREEYRLSVIEKMLRDKFARLEGFLQEMQGQSDYLAAMASNISSSLTSTTSRG